MSRMLLFPGQGAQAVGMGRELAEGLAEGILAYKDRLLKRRTVQNSLTQEGAGAM